MKFYSLDSKKNKMKNILIIAILFLANANFGIGQSLNWNTIEQNRTAQLYLNIGYDFGATTQLGYAYKLNTKKPIVLSADFSIPMGDQLDDFKFRIGGQVGLIQRGNFRTSVGYLGILRRNETSLVKQIGIGQQLSISTGIYKDKWHLALSVAYDASIATNLKHSEIMRNNYSDIKDDWYAGAGGQWNYGLEASRKLGERLELNISVGATNARGNDYDALLPIYFKLGGVFFFGSSTN